MDSDGKRGTLRAAVAKAILDFTRLEAGNRGHEDAFVTGWAVSAEYTTVDLHRTGYTGNMVILAEDQSTALSRGLYAMGGDAFRMDD